MSDDQIANILTWGAGIVVLGAAIFLLFSYFVKCRDAFLAGLRGIKLIERERKTPRLREALDEWEEHHPRLMWGMGFSAIVFLLSGIAIGFWSEYHRPIASVAVGILILALGFLDETSWRFWVILLAGLVWLYGYRRNRRRQEAIIELLLEIRRKLGE